MKFEAISYDHAAKLLGQRPWDVSRSPELLAKAQIAATNTYAMSSCIVGLDIYNVEAEAYGCEIIDSGGNGVPVPGDAPFTSVKELLALDVDLLNLGRVPMIFEAARQVSALCPEAEVRIPMSGPFTIACHLIGMENMICEMVMEPDASAEALMLLADNQVRYAQRAVELGHTISLFESSVTPPLLSPDMFAKSVCPALSKIVSAAGDDVQLIIGGDTIHILDSILSLSPSYVICPVETDQGAFLSRLGDSAVEVRVNMSPSVFLPGNETAAMTEASRAMDLASRSAHSCVGLILPFDADQSTVNTVREYFASGGD